MRSRSADGDGLDRGREMELVGELDDGSDGRPAPSCGLEGESTRRGGSGFVESVAGGSGDLHIRDGPVLGDDELETDGSLEALAEGGVRVRGRRRAS